jgi:hypothetical protein
LVVEEVNGFRNPAIKIPGVDQHSLNILSKRLHKATGLNCVFML